MAKIAIATIVLLSLATATGCWFVYALEYQRLGRETREIQATEQAALESEMYQAWHFALRYEAFRGPLVSSKEWPKDIKTYDRRDVWVKSFQRSDVKLAGKSEKFGNGSYLVTSTIGVQDRVSDAMFREMFRRRAPASVLDFARSEVWHHLSVRCKVEKMDAPGDWSVSDWTFSPITYSGDFPFQLAKSGE